MTETLPRPSHAPALPPRPATPDWIQCPRCAMLVYGKRYSRNLGVCPECGHHSRLSAPERLAQLLDPGSARPLDVAAHAVDPLGFHDSVSYQERLEHARAGTGLDEAVICARGTLEGHPIVVALMDFRFMGGSLGSASGELITRAAEAALDDAVPLVVATASGGARMQEGALSLMQMAKTSQAFAQLDEAGLLTVTIVTDPTYGGVAASFAALSDVILAEPGARMGFAGPGVIENTIRQRLPDGFQSAEQLRGRGLVDDVLPRHQLRPVLARLLAASRRREPALPPRQDPVIRRADILAARDPWEVVRAARDTRRPTTLDLASRLLTGFHELHGDRSGGDCPAIVGGIGLIAGLPVMLIGHQKGHNTRELAGRNFGMASPEGYRKSARLLRLAEKLGIAVLMFIDTPGAHPGPSAEEKGQAIAIAENLRLLSTLTVPVVAVVIGEGGSGGALALGIANRVLACANAFYSVISPEGCASILWKTAAAAPRAAAALRIEARELLTLGIVDGVVPEPPTGAQGDPAGAASLLGDAVLSELAGLLRLPPEELRRSRRERFRRFGADACA